MIIETTAKWNAEKLLSGFEICVWNGAAKNALDGVVAIVSCFKMPFYSNGVF